MLPRIRILSGGHQTDAPSSSAAGESTGLGRHTHTHGKKQTNIDWAQISFQPNWPPSMGVLEGEWSVKRVGKMLR